MDSSYLKLTTGSRITNYVGLKMFGDTKFTHGKNYLFLEIPVLGVETEDGSLTTEVKRNQHVFIRAACTVDVKGSNIVEIEPNPALAEYGQLQPGYKVHPGEGQKQVGVWFTARKDTDLTTLDYVVRLYLIA